MNVDFNKLIERVKLVILSPAAAWDTISAEDTPQKDLAINTLAPLILLSTAVTLVDNLLFNRLGLMFSITNSVVVAVASLLTSFLASYVINKLAPMFGGGVSLPRAFSLVVHAQIPALTGGIFTVVPLLGPLLGFGLALYAIYVFFLGATKMAAVPQQNAIWFTAATYACMIAILVVSISVLGAMILVSPVSPITLPTTY
jgi:hypothetical protein